MNHIHIFVLMMLSLQSAASGIDTPSAEFDSADAVHPLRREVGLLSAKYRANPISRDSPDHAIILRIGRAAETSETLIEELIELTEIKETPPDTSERITPLSQSPAGNLLWSMRQQSERAIKARMLDDTLTERQRAVLKAITRGWAMIDEGRRRDEENAEILVTRAGAMSGESDSPPGFQSSDTEAVPDEPNPNGKLVWTMLVAAGVLVLVWLGIRCRCCIRKRAGTAAAAWPPTRQMGAHEGFDIEELP